MNWHDTTVYLTCFTLKEGMEFVKAQYYGRLTFLFLWGFVCKIHGRALCLKIILRRTGIRNSFRDTPFGEVASMICDKA